VSEPFEVAVRGRRVEGVRAGGPEGIPCLLLHGAGQDHRALEPLASCLRAPAIVPSLPGRRGSEGAPLESVAALARWCEALLDALGIAEIRVAGHSFGGAVALELALASPRVNALALVSTGARLRVSPFILEQARRASDRGEPNPFGDAAVPASTALADWLAADRFDRLRDLGGRRVPTWVAVGAGDPLTPPRYALFLAHHLSGALRVFEAAGHDLPRERPRELADWLFAGDAPMEMR
jgi:pimeloyl-ACP methyl ester carboxylesterase